MSSALQPPEVSRVLRGDLDNLPRQDSNVVRIFLSSTFTDYGEERNMLAREAIPQLRTYCQQKGLDFQVADMRWGVRDDAQTEHHTTELLMKEIKNCQDISKGPNFVVLLANRYGFRDYPSKIEAEEFDILVRAAYTVSKDPSLLDEWYKRDDNAVPPEYVIQPITSKFHYYDDEAEERKKLRNKDRTQWTAVNDLLANLFRDAASCAYKYGHFTAEQREKYFTSVTEKEVNAGILAIKNASETTLCFQRDFDNLDIEDKLAGRFIDLDAGLEDTEAQYLLKELKTSKVPRSLRKEIVYNNVKWTEKGINPDDIKHAKYLEDFKEDFIAKVGEKIYTALQKQENLNTDVDLYNEVLHHNHFCLMKTHVFVGRQETLNRIKLKLNKIFYVEEYLPGLDNQNDMDTLLDNLPKTNTEADNRETQLAKENEEMKASMKQLGVHMAEEVTYFDDSMDVEKTKLLFCQKLTKYTKPLIIYGTSGSGKTAMMAMIGTKVHNWFEYKPVTVIRFLGTSPQTGTIRNVLTSICQQIWENYEGVKPPSTSMFNLSKDFAYLVQYFKALIGRIDTSKKPLVIIIDSVDQLRADDNAYNMTWLPTHLPPNVYLLVSMLPDEHGLLYAVQGRIPDDERFIEMPALPKDVGASILEQWLTQAKRTLTKEQKEILLAKLRMCPQPLFLKLSFEQARYWHSYTKHNEMTLGVTIRSLVEQFFIMLEKVHGQVLTSRALGYMTIARNGISDAEMEDILSLDDDVLQDTYLYHLPPDPNTIRLPPLLWVRIKNDLAEYVTKQQANGKTIVRWFHRQFWEAAEKRYVTSDVAGLYHSNMADYYTGKWSDSVKPLELTKKKQGSYPNSYRGVPAQPVIFSNNLYNLRKMELLPMHLLMCKRYEDFVSELCYNFDWIYYKCKALGVVAVLDDLRVALELIGGEIKAIKDEIEEERKRKERERKKRHKAPTDLTEIGKSQVKISGILDEPEEETEEETHKPVAHDNDQSELPAQSNDMAFNSGSIFQLTSQEPRTLDELEELYAEIDLVQNMLHLGMDSISKDPNNVIMQTLGQVATGEECKEADGLQRLRSQAREFADKCSLPLLTPESKCLPSPGGELRTSVDISLGFPGDSYKMENKMSMSKDGRYLYIVSRSKTRERDLKKGIGGDFLHKYDLAKGGVQESLTQMMGCDIKWMQLVGGDRYMYFENYTQRDELNPKYFTVVKDLAKDIMLPFTPDMTVISFSKSGKLCLVVEPYYRKDKGPTLGSMSMSRGQEFVQNQDEGEHEIGTQTELSTVPSVEIAAMFDLETQQKTSLKVILGEGDGEVSDKDLKSLVVNHGIFSPDEKFVVVLTNSGTVYCFLTERGKYMYKWEENATSNMISPCITSSASGKVYKGIMVILQNNYLLMPGCGYESCQHLVLRNLNNGEAIKEFTGHEYSIGLLEVSLKEEYIATATTDTSTINSNTNKDLIVWNIEKGEKFSTCKGRDAWVALKFFGEKSEYLLTTSSNDKLSRVLLVWYIGTGKKPCPDALPIHHIIGHSDTVVKIDISPNYHAVVTGSKDNTVRFWSLDKITEKCESMLALAESLGMSGLKEYLMTHDDDKPKNPAENSIRTTAFTVCRGTNICSVGSDQGWLMFINLDEHRMINSQKVYLESCMGRGGGVSHLIITKDGKFVVSAGGKGEPIILWDSRTGEEVKRIATDHEISCMAEANNVLVVGQSGMECYGYLYDLNQGVLVNKLQGLYGFSHLCVTSDAKKVATTMFDFPMIFDSQSGEQIQFSQQSDTMMSGCSFMCLSPCDGYLVACSTDGSVRVVEVPTATYCYKMRHKSSVVSAEFSPDSKFLVTAGFRSILVWSMKTGDLSHSLLRHQDFITQLNFACEGKYLVSCSKDKQIILWDFKNGKSIAGFHAHCPVNKMHFAPDISSVLYAPENVGYIAILKPNGVLKEVIKGEEKNAVPEPIVQAQAFAFTFSGQKAKVKSSAACNIL